MQRWLICCLAVLVALSGCMAPKAAIVRPTGADPLEVASRQSAPDLLGRVQFDGRSTQAQTSDVAVGATVSLIDTATNQTVESAVTDASGVFRLVFKSGFSPDPARTYYLEAFKGLGGNLPGSNAARVRTIVNFQTGPGWQSLTGAAIVVSPSTTALSIAAPLLGLSTADDLALMGSITPGSPDTYAAPAQGPSNGDFSQLGPLVIAALAADEDPIANIGLVSGSWARLHRPLLLTSVSPASASAGTSVTFYGSGFDLANAASNSVSFSGVLATAVSVSPTQLQVVVPYGAVSGQTVIQVGGTKVLGPLFTIPVAVTGFSPTSGLVGSTVTISGNGFDTQAANDSVFFNGVKAPVLAASPSTLVVTVPYGATTGPLSVGVGGQSTASTASFGVLNPAIYAAYPMVTSPYATVSLEGDFATDITVVFSGGAWASAQWLGDHRAQVVVPYSATDGTLTVTSGGQTTWLPGFRVSRYSYGLQSFSANHDQTMVAMSSPSLSVARLGHTATVIGNWLYVVGGWNGSTNYNSIERALINADGTLGNFSTVTGVTLATARRFHSAQVVGNWLYVFGGQGGAVLNSVERAPIGANGALGPFSPYGSGSVTGRAGAASAVMHRYVYLFGGENAGLLSSVERALIGANGDLGAFQTVSGVSVPGGRSFPAIAVTGPYVYLLGGNTGTATSEILRAPIDNGGIMGTFTSSGNLYAARAQGNALALGNKLVITGGSDGSTETAVINPDGTLGTFSAIPTDAWYATSHGYGASALVGANLYVIGGGSGSGIDRCSINGSGGFSNFSTMGIAMTQDRSAAFSAVLGNFLYMIGGRRSSGDLTTVERAPVASDGTLGAFEAVPGVNLATGRSGGGTMVANGWLYALGGSSNGTPSFAIERAPIASDGTLGAFTTLGTTLNQSPRDAFWVNGTRLYASGGNALSIEAATINSDGSLGTFAAAGPSLPQPTVGQGVAVAGRYVYLTGGQQSGSAVNVVYRAALNPDGTMGTPGSVGSLMTARYNHRCAVVGGYLYVIGGRNNSNELTSTERAAINPDGTLGTFMNYSSAFLMSPRSGQTVVTLGGYLYAIGGWSSSTALSTVERTTLQ